MKKKTGAKNSLKSQEGRYFQAIRMLICVRCGTNQGIEVSHLRKTCDGGMGKKPSMWFVLPLCHRCHAESHRGEVTFWGGMEGVYRVKRLALDLYEAKDIFGRRRLIMEYRKERL